ncbi:MAG TPA: dihydrolipoamide acetyltransferase family protein [Alphaproteobacteria bacterium]|nr:dihydrolipoamide acetyltransferase family protein [Alphaproteobacteria bacterium]
MSTFRLPDLGEGLQEAEIVAWHVALGQHVVKEQPLVSVETDKAVVEIPSPQAGQIAMLYGTPGDHLAVGAPLVEFAEDASADKGAIVGEIDRPEPASSTTAATRAPAAASPAGQVKAAPAIRARAKELGVDLSRVVPSGVAGQITREDVEKAAVRQTAAEGYHALSGVRRAMARNMARSGAEVVPATVTDEADVEAWPDGSDITARLVRALVAACRAEPSLNAWFDSKTLSRRLHQAVDIGIAVDTEDGLIVPVLRNIEADDLAGIRRSLAKLVASARERTLPPEALSGATITLSNFGTLGGRHGVLVIVPPQVAILGAGRLAPQVVPSGGNVVIRRRLPLSLTFDHRAVSGGEAARFLAALIGDLESPE